MRVVLLLFLGALLLFAETFKLYLKDGDYHLVREYQVLSDRIRYYSTERGQWEEIPKDLVDLDKTEKARNAQEQESAKVAREENEERQAVRAQEKEIASIPQDIGAYYEVGDQVKALKPADYQVITSKKRKTVQMLSPIPIVPGKATVLIQGAHAQFLIADDRPSFFVRPAKEEQFGIIRVEPKKNVRIVENISIAPVVNLPEENRKQMDTFQQQLADGLYRIWPEKALTPGEYAVIEFGSNDEKDDIEMMVWDFAIEPSK